MKNIENEINDILAHWNPINVPYELAHDEYKSYVQTILKNGNNKDLLFECMCNITMSIIGSGFEITNEMHVNDLKQVCDEIFKIIDKK